MSTVADAVTSVRALLQDEDKSSYAFPTTFLETTLAMAARALAPVVCKKERLGVTAVPDQEEYDLATLASRDVYSVVELDFQDGLICGWYFHEGDLVFPDETPTDDFVVWLVGGYVDVTELPDPLVDVVVLETCSRALRWLLRRGGQGLQNYLVDQGLFEFNELAAVSDGYHQDFLVGREEWGTTTTVMVGL